MVIKHLENKIRLVGSHLHCFSCRVYHHQCVKYLDCPDNGDGRTEKGVCAGRKCTYTRNPHEMDETLDVEAKSHVEMFHHYFFTLAPDDKYIRYTMEKAMYLVDETGLAQYNTLKEKGFTPTYWVRARCSRFSVTVSPLTKRIWSSPTMVGSESNVGVIS